MIINKIAVIGTGLMGKGISHTLASFGYNVDLFGRRDEVENELFEYFNREVDKERITPEQKISILKNISIFNINLDAKKLADSDLVIETVKEDIDTKKWIFSIIDRYVNSDAILASNTSGFSITKLAEFTSYPENFVGMHFFSPVPLMKLVEVIKGEKTSDVVLQKTVKLLESIGKLPIKVKDSPGFVLNKGLGALTNAAINAYYEGIVESAEDIDNIFIHGMSLKVGPLKLADLIGIDVVYDSMLHVYEETKDEKYRPCPMLKNMVDEGRIGKKVRRGFYNYEK